MKVTAFIGSARKKYTYNASERLLKKLQSYGDVEYEIVQLSDYNLGVCKGCKLCTDKGEELCPLKDDRDVLIDKMLNSDGVVFASPNYFFQVSAQMKLLLDRLAYFGHRPRFFGKAFTSIVSQGVFKGWDIVKYLNFIGDVMGFNVVKGACITTLEPMTEKGHHKIDMKIDKLSKRFYKKLIKKAYPKPSVLKLMMFRMSRSLMKAMLTDEYRDYTYFKENGLFESNYFYPVRLNPFEKLLGHLSEKMGTNMAKKK